MQTKKIPMRMCVGCGEMMPKQTLIRIVKTPENEIKIDLRGKMSGRGAYICKSAECLKKAYKQKRLERAFKTQITDEIYSLLEKDLANE